MPRQFQLDAPTLEEARAKALREYGPTARIVKAERVYDKGLRGLLGRQHVEVLVEAPDPPKPAEPGYGLSERLGIAALLADADAADQAPGLGQVHLSTEEPRFEDVLNSLAADTTPDGDQG
ncbi:hypothetical protein [Sinomonas gamaensis]|uniref:hypothetical protein n=1 Tax=Sinomonas gamaensis TaxID=2565624 RepID=UPI00110A05C5|nr:hypothetical protein [Sinomonas gamaensis]